LTLKLLKHERKLAGEFSSEFLTILLSPSRPGWVIIYLWIGWVCFEVTAGRRILCQEIVKLVLVTGVIKFWSENLKGRDHSEDPGLDGKIILEWILWK